MSCSRYRRGFPLSSGRLVTAFGRNISPKRSGSLEIAKRWRLTPNHNHRCINESHRYQTAGQLTTHFVTTPRRKGDVCSASLVSSLRDGLAWSEDGTVLSPPISSQHVVCEFASVIGNLEPNTIKETLLGTTGQQVPLGKGRNLEGESISLGPNDAQASGLLPRNHNKYNTYTNTT